MASASGERQNDLWVYKSPITHEGMSAIIRRHSTNKADIRDVALDDLDLSEAHSVLDLGCGFGFMAEAVADRVASDARFVGVDAWRDNGESFCEKVINTGRRAEFVCMDVNSELPWPDRGFDLVICSYALYFFPDILSEIARVLAPHGMFLAITHCEEGMVGDLPEAGFEDAVEGLLALIRRFCAENGRDQLCTWFGDVTRINYLNALQFKADDVDELFAYLRFKMPFLVPGSQPGDKLPENLAQFARDLAVREGEVVIDKNDAVFRCRRPLCH